ncbi:hypothetical protein Tco_1338792 [Tanacetum coccineum]
MGADNKTFASVLIAEKGKPSKAIDSSPVIVLDDEYLVERDFSCSLMGKIKDLNVLPNLYLILSNEGFDNVKLTYLGGLLNMDSIETKEKVFKHVGVKSWFNGLHQASHSFGELTDVEDSESTTLSYKRLYGEERENDNGNLVNDSQSDNENELDDNENDIDHVSESSCTNVNDHEYNNASKCIEHPINFDDPFKIYKILDKNNEKGELEMNKDKVLSESTDPQFPPGFTPKVGRKNVDEAKSARDSQPKKDLIGANEDVASVSSGIKGFTTYKSGGSLLDVIDELIKVGHAMGYNMDGYIKNIETIINSQGDRQDGECVFLGEFNEVRSIQERYGTVFYHLGANSFNNFITMAGLVDLPLEGYSCNEDLVSERSKLLKELYDFNSNASLDMIQKAKIRWAIEGDENSKYFHGIINKKRSQLAIRRVLVEGDWIVDPSHVKKKFLNHFSNRFVEPNSPRLCIDFQFPNTLSSDQLSDIERDVTYDEIKKSVWDCRTNKSPGPDGFTFEFFRRY